MQVSYLSVYSMSRLVLILSMIVIFLHTRVQCCRDYSVVLSMDTAKFRLITLRYIARIGILQVFNSHDYRQRLSIHTLYFF